MSTTTGWTPDELATARERIGVTDATLRQAASAPTFEQACAQVDALKADAKKRYRAWALKLHPDRTGGDADLMRQFQCLGACFGELTKMELRAGPPPAPPRPRPVMRTTVIIVGGWSSSTSTSSTSTIW